jgi:MFS family permease
MHNTGKPLKFRYNRRMQSTKMSATERLAVGSLATIMSLRLVGLFMILPVFALYAHQLVNATPFLIGIAMGIYGLTQALLQIPFGMLSDHIGRKPVITLGLLLFILGSIIAALSHSINVMILGRALQGAGAVGSTLIAMIADLTREEQRTKAMAINGMIIGISFSMSMVLGPLVATWIHISGIFWLASILSIIAIIILFTIAPTPAKTSWHSDAEVAPSMLSTLLKDHQLMRLNSGAFLLHALFTASFVVIPIGLQKLAGLPGNKQWLLFAPTLACSFVFTLFMIVMAEKKRQVKQYFLLGISLLVCSELILLTFTSSLFASTFGLFILFGSFSLLEALLPSSISRVAPKTRKGTAMGLYSCLQFLGIFVGGMVGGWLYGAFGLQSVYLFCVMLALLWLPIAFGMKNPQYQPSANNTPIPAMGKRI